MPRKIIIFSVVILVLLAGGAVFALNRNTADPATSGTTQLDGSAATESTSPPPTTDPQAAREADDNCPTEETPVITVSASAFSPSCVTVKAGTTITWKNDSGSQIQIGSDPHPSHTGNREVSGGEFTLDIASGNSASSVLTTTGDHSYHDHLNPSARGTIKVEN